MSRTTLPRVADSTQAGVTENVGSLLEQVIEVGITRYHREWVGLQWPDDKHNAANYGPNACLSDTELISGWAKAHIEARGFRREVYWRSDGPNQPLQCQVKVESWFTPWLETELEAHLVALYSVLRHTTPTQ